MSIFRQLATFATSYVSQQKIFSSYQLFGAQEMSRASQEIFEDQDRFHFNVFLNADSKLPAPHSPELKVKGFISKNPQLMLFVFDVTTSLCSRETRRASS